MALTTVDRTLIHRCLHHEPGAWNDFIDRFLGLIYHVIHHTAYLRSTPLRPEETEDIAAEILLQIVSGEYAVLKAFRGHSSLSTYLTVIARRICIQEMSRTAAAREVLPKAESERLLEKEAEQPERGQLGLESLEEVQKLLRRLPQRERRVVRLYYLEGRTYEEIGTELHIPVNSIGPILSRARKKLRKPSKPPSTNGKEGKPKAKEEGGAKQGG